MAIRIATNIPSLQGHTVHLGGVMKLATGKMVDDSITPTTLINNPNCVVADGTHVDYIFDSPMVFLTPGDPFYDITPGVIIDNTEFSETDINTIYNSGGYIRSTFNQQQNKFIATAHHGTQALSLLLDNHNTITNIYNNAGGITPSISTFTELNDTPSTYTGQAGKVVAVNTSEDGVEFVQNVDVFTKEHLGATLLPTGLNNKNTITGDGSIVGGTNITNGYPFSVVSGTNGTNMTSGFSLLSNGFACITDTVLAQISTGNTLMAMVNLQGFPGIPISDGYSYMYDIQVSAIDVGNVQNNYGMNHKGFVINDGGTFSQANIGSTAMSTNVASVSSLVTYDLLNKLLVVNIIGEVATTYRWVANCRLTITKLT